VPAYFGRKTLWKPVERDTMEEMGVPSMMSSRYEEMADIDAATATLDKFGY
jgi:hypothetical protein